MELLLECHVLLLRYIWNEPHVLYEEWHGCDETICKLSDGHEGFSDLWKDDDQPIRKTILASELCGRLIASAENLGKKYSDGEKQGLS